MERLTKRITQYTIELSASANPIQYNGSSQRVHIKHPFWNVFDRLCKYEDAEENGLLLRPKCRLGNIVYALWSIPTEARYVIYPAEVKEISLSSTNARKMIMYKLEPISFRGRYNKYYDDDFGKLVFLTEAEAEQALRQMGE